MGNTPAPQVLTTTFSFKIIFFVFGFFLILLVLYYHTLLSSFQNQIESQQKQVLFKIKEEIKSDLLNHLKEAQEDPYYLYTIGSRTGLRVTLFNEERIVVTDSIGKIKAGQRLDLSESDFKGIENLWRNGEVFYTFFVNKDQKKVISLFDLLPVNTAVSLGIRFSQENELPKNSESEIYLFFLKLLGGIGLLTLGMVLYRFFRTILEKESFFGTSNIQDPNPVLNTFQELIQELKGKEQELEKLKNLAENRATQSENFQDAILRSVTSGVITFDQNKVITSFNASAEKIFGISRQEAIGKECSEVFGKEGKILYLLNKTLLENRSITRDEFEIVKGKTQEKIWIGVSSSFLKDSLEKFLGTTFIFTDITEIKALQEQIDLQKRLTVLGEMSAGIAHEFRNFMGTIFGYIRLLDKKFAKELPEHKMIEAVITELRSMDHLIHELLSFGKKTPLNQSRVVLEPFFSKLIQQLFPYPDSGIKVTCEISDPSPAVFADEILIRQAFINLIQNAVEAMPDGGVISIKAGFNQAGGNSSMVLIQIKDTGTGISKDHLEKIFVPFFTLKEKGTGLGLPIVHKIILSHGGRIRVESEEGRGTLFKIYLPGG